MVAGAGKHVCITSAQNKKSCGTINNTANVTTSNDGSSQGRGSHTVIHGGGSSDVSSADVTVSAGDTIGFVIAAGNSGAGEARGVTVTDVVPVVAGVSWS